MWYLFSTFDMSQAGMWFISWQTGLLRRTICPQRMKANGIKLIIRANNPKSEQAHCTPRVVYIGLAASGRHVAKSDLVVLAAASAGADDCLYASAR